MARSTHFDFAVFCMCQKARVYLFDDVINVEKYNTQRNTTFCTACVDIFEITKDRILKRPLRNVLLLIFELCFFRLNIFITPRHFR